MKYDKSELSVTGPDPTKEEAKALRKKFEVMQELQKKKNKKKIYSVVGALAAGAILALVSYKAFFRDPPKESNRAGGSGADIQGLRVSVGDTCTPGVDCVEGETPRERQARLQREFEAQQAAQKRRAKKGSSSPKLGQKSDKTVDGSAAAPGDDRTDVQKRIANMYQPVAKAPMAKGSEARGKTERGLSVNTNLLGVKAKPITGEEIDKKIKAWGKGLSSCKTQIGQQAITLRFSIEKSGLVGSVKVQFEGEDDPEMAGCIRKVLRKKILRPLPKKQNFTRELRL